MHPIEVRKIKYGEIPDIEAEIERLSDTSTCFCEEFNECPDFDIEEEGCSGGCQCEAYNIVQNLYGDLDKAKQKLEDIQASCIHAWTFYHGTTAENYRPFHSCIKCLLTEEQLDPMPPTRGLSGFVRYDTEGGFDPSMES